jgi:hypothetical protein
VRLTVNGGGATLGRLKVMGGTGTFSSVPSISDVYGTYVEIGAHAGAGRSADARAMLKDNVSLSLAGLGEGVSVGTSIGAFSIQPR